MNIVIELPDEFVDEAGGVEAVAARARAELAVHAYRERWVTLGRAAEISGLGRGEFERLLRSHRAERDYGPAELAGDVAWAQSTASGGGCTG